MNFALATLWYERQRYLPGILAVAFGAVLIALTCGLLLGLLSITTIPITHTRADVWVGSAGVLSVDIAGVVPTSWYSRVMESPEVTACEEYCEGFSKWRKFNGADELIIIVGSRLEDKSIGAVNRADAGITGKVDRAELRRNRPIRVTPAGFDDRVG